MYQSFYIPGGPSFEQVQDEHPFTNYWHHPSILEGNYWSDYTGVDDGSGIDKHSIAGDGIGDTLIPHPGSDYDFYPFTRRNGWEEVEATIEIHPETLNLKSNGRWVQCIIKLQGPFYYTDINPDTVFLEMDIPAENPEMTGDSLNVKFARDDLKDILGIGSVTLTVTGNLYNGTPFVGSDTVRVINP